MKVVAVLLLVCHVTSATAVVPFFVTMLAAVDGGHAVVVEYQQGGVGIRLHHQAGDFTPCLRDHHSLAGRLAATLCGAAKTDGDHVLAASDSMPNTELKKRQAFSSRLLAEKAASVILSIDMQALTRVQCITQVQLARNDEARRHVLHARRQALSCVILLV